MAYNYTKQGGNPKVDSINDKTDYKAVCAAMKILGFTNDQADSLWKIVAAVVTLGNVEFVTDNDETKIKDKKLLQNLSQLLGVTVDALEKTLCQRVIAAGGEVMEKGHTACEAIYGRDAFAKVIYISKSYFLLQNITFFNRRYIV